MSEANLVRRTWIVDILPDGVRMRCVYGRRAKRIVQYTVQLEFRHAEKWRPVVRYDNSHGFCHRDTIHPDGTQDKIAIFYGTANETFTLAIEEMRDNWKAHCARFLGESEP